MGHKICSSCDGIWRYVVVEVKSSILACQEGFNVSALLTTGNTENILIWVSHSL